MYRFGSGKSSHKSGAGGMCWDRHRCALSVGLGMVIEVLWQASKLAVRWLLRLAGDGGLTTVGAWMALVRLCVRSRPLLVPRPMQFMTFLGSKRMLYVPDRPGHARHKAQGSEQSSPHDRQQSPPTAPRRCLHGVMGLTTLALSGGSGGGS